MGRTAIGADDLLDMYRSMYTIRRFEERAGRLYRDGHIPGFVHLAIGQEAAAVGACRHLSTDDVITSTHRGHGHALAKGLDPRELFAELMGRETGVCRGRGGSMHVADPSRGIFGANGIVGAGIPIAGGAALAARLRRTSGVAVAFLGDGAVSTGAFHEATNLAALWKLPFVLFCENNQFSEFSAAADQQPVDLQTRARGYDLAYHRVDGNDVAATSQLMVEVLADVRAGRGPCLVEAVTLRVQGHYEGDPQLYRKGFSQTFADPLDVTRGQLEVGGVRSEVERVEREVEELLDRAVEEAMAAPHPKPDELGVGMIVERPATPAAEVEPFTPTTGRGDGIWKTYQAVGAALRHEIEADESVFIAGIDVGKGGNVFGIMRGMQEEWPERVRDTPISETAIVGLGVGAAMAGLKPVLEIMYFDFIGVCLDQLMNQAAKLPYMTGGRASMNLTIRTQFGAGRSSGAQHSQSLEAMLAHIPGLTVLMPSTPADAYGLLRAAIQDPNPVVFVENRLLYGQKGPRCEPDHLVPIGKAAIRRTGTDLTMVSYSRSALACEAVAERLQADGISCEVIDLRTIAPLDVATVLDSVRKTNRLLVVHEAHRDFGVGAEIAARIAEDGVWFLDAPIMRVGARSVPAPYSPVLEKEWLPDEERIAEAAMKLARV
ncbi:alpha-ketoacid dehydrogenase subunit alpha/beta [Pseudonocardia pini]|uniref:alpha-ketoacid dehydrogenase subunit alpha/beta n=1 Tax=Pseudonocardia pini TaxID=2758030 RepID=UPI0028AE343C|nr:dehydrogenase E1 component subunit alpha/beta [Pseudonocardia pini]